MSREELKKSPPAAAAVDNITTAAAAESTKRPRDNAEIVGGIDEDERKPPPKLSRTASSAAASDMTLLRTLRPTQTPTSVETVDVNVNGSFAGKFIVGTLVERALVLLRRKAGEGWLKDKDGVLVLDDELLSAHRAPYDFLSFEQANPSPVETGGNGPPSDGTSMPRQSEPRYAPSTIEGKEEGLNHASNERNTMQCTSHPVCLRLLQLLETAIAEGDRDTWTRNFVPLQSTSSLRGSACSRRTVLVRTKDSSRVPCAMQ